jgi:predicted enzyme related to lactoylglutathione lyase
MNFPRRAGLPGGVAPASAKPIVHLELHTANLARACAFYRQLCGWRPERIESRAGAYLALQLGGGLDGGVVECDTCRDLWLPYVEVGDVSAVTERAYELGGSVLLAPREGPAGWRSVVAAPAGGEIAFWQPKGSNAAMAGERGGRREDPPA